MDGDLDIDEVILLNRPGSDERFECMVTDIRMSRLKGTCFVVAYTDNPDVYIEILARIAVTCPALGSSYETSSLVFTPKSPCSFKQIRVYTDDPLCQRAVMALL